MELVLPDSGLAQLLFVWVSLLLRFVPVIAVAVLAIFWSRSNRRRDAQLAAIHERLAVLERERDAIT